MQLVRLYHTLRHLRPQQFWYRVYYPLRKMLYRPALPGITFLEAAAAFPQMDFFPAPVFDIYDPQSHSFTLLNITQHYPETIDWNDDRNGALWQYHLNYFSWLEDDSLTVNDRLETVQQYLRAANTLRIGPDAYPVSLRGICWIRFFLKNEIRDAALNGLLYGHYHRLYSFPEYHLQGNHLWENGCSLLWAGHYFNEKNFFEKGKKILVKALHEQIVEDGAHVEGSPMYHSLLLLRLLQTIELCGASARYPDEPLTMLMRAKAALMLGWLQGITFSTGEWPAVNDSAPGVAPSTDFLLRLGAHLNITPQQRPLSASGYRLWRRARFELFIDAANILPAYQPGHNHADTFSFCLNVDGRPVITDTGVSTYANDATRKTERGTAAHNTVVVAGSNSSDVWKSFRIGSRAGISILQESDNKLSAEQDGYRHLGVIHRRTFYAEEHKIIITDTLKNLKTKSAAVFLHFNPEILLTKTVAGSYLAQNLLINFDGAAAVAIKSYFFAAGFNVTRPAQCLHISFTGELKTILQLRNTPC